LSNAKREIIISFDVEMLIISQSSPVWEIIVYPFAQSKLKIQSPTPLYLSRLFTCPAYLKSQLNAILQEVLPINIQVIMVGEQGPQHHVALIPPPSLVKGVGIEVLGGFTTDWAKTSVRIMDMLPQGRKIAKKRTTIGANEGSSITHGFPPPLSLSRP
jgi:hypothetical protein